MQQCTTALAFVAAATPSFVSKFTAKTRNASHSAEFDCDARAVKATGNPDAAISALQKLTRLKGYSLDEGGRFHPSTNDRVNAIRNMSQSAPRTRRVSPNIPLPA